MEKLIKVTSPANDLATLTITFGRSMFLITIHPHLCSIFTHKLESYTIIGICRRHRNNLVIIAFKGYFIEVLL